MQVWHRSKKHNCGDRNDSKRSSRRQNDCGETKKETEGN